MGISRPTGEYAAQMLEPGGWPEADEDTFYDRAQEYNQILRKVTDVMDSCRHQQVEVFEGGVWSGGAANAANGALGENLGQMSTLQGYLATVITWHQHVAGLVVQAKSEIGNNVDGAQRQISILTNDPELTAEERKSAINAVVQTAHAANTSLVADAAEQVFASKDWRPSSNALEDLLQQVTPPIPDIPFLAESPSNASSPVVSTPTPYHPTPVAPGLPVTPRPVTPVGSAPEVPGSQTPIAPIIPGAPVSPSLGQPGSSGPAVPGTPFTPGTPFIPGKPGKPATSGPPFVPGKPFTPATPGKPFTPATPGKPFTPATPGKPFTPATPGSSHPNVPSMPDLPGSSSPTVPGNPVSVPPVTSTPTPVPPVTSTPTPVPPVTSTPTPGASPSAPTAPGLSPHSSPMGPGAPDRPLPVMDPGTSSTPAVAGAEPGAQVKPAAMTEVPVASGTGQAGAPASGASHPDEFSPGVAPAAATGMPGTTPRTSVSSGSAPSAAGASPSGGAVAASGTGSRAAGSGRAPLGASGKSAAPATRAASARTTAPPPRPQASEHAPEEGAPEKNQKESTDTVTPSPSVPVSAARAARDAIAASTVGKKRGKDPLRLARRIAAALNAPDNGSQGAYGFFWITAVTTDGEIVVANSYGLAYLPDDVELPAKVHLASADHAIPAEEKARCATYPVLAVQGWATYHDLKLRAVIGTAEQLANSDSGAVKIVLEPDDIPESGQMVGRSRLEVVNPAAAAQLADTDDLGLTNLLPPAPVAENPPDDQRHMLWFELMKPMTSTAIGREVPHLRAFQAFAAHSQQLALHQGYAAVDPAARRAAVADWLYWQYVVELLGSALSGTP